jgi:hypothetical protein
MQDSIQLGHPPFKYSSIPGIEGQGYQTIHIEGAKAILVLLPHTIKGIVAHGPLQDNFVHLAAILLCIPEKYTKLLAQLGQEIMPTRRTVSYTEAQFGATARLSVNKVAHFLATIGVTAKEAEWWRPWAAAYVEMELEAQPNSYHMLKLQQARDAARARINTDLKWVFRNIYPDAPGNYNPGCGQAHAARNAAQVKRHKLHIANKEAGPSSAASDNILL